MTQLWARTVGRHVAPPPANNFGRIEVYVRDVNMNFLRRRREQHGMSVTESVAHALSILETVETAMKEGGEVVLKPRNEPAYRLKLSW